MTSPASEALFARVADALASEPTLRVTRMFRSRAFMVHDLMVVAVRNDGGLLVRADPQRSDELARRPGASPGQMGTGRPMGPSWLEVSADAAATDLDAWLGEARAYHEVLRAGA